MSSARSPAICPLELGHPGAGAHGASRPGPGRTSVASRPRPRAGRTCVSPTSSGPLPGEHLPQPLRRASSAITARRPRGEIGGTAGGGSTAPGAGAAGGPGARHRSERAPLHPAPGRVARLGRPRARDEPSTGGGGGRALRRRILVAAHRMAGGLRSRTDRASGAAGPVRPGSTRVRSGLREDRRVLPVDRRGAERRRLMWRSTDTIARRCSGVAPQVVAGSPVVRPGGTLRDGTGIAREVEHAET